MSDNASAAAALAAAGPHPQPVVEESEQAAVLALAAAATARKVGGAAGTDGSSPLAAGPPTKSLNSGSLSGGDAISPLSEDASDDDPSDQQAQGGLSGHRNSGSLSNLASADWRGGQSSEGQQQPPPALVQQQQQAALPLAAQDGLEAARQAAQLQQAMAQAAAAAAGQHAGQGRQATPSTARGRRNARQQEQNKQAQQRYRAKRKAQFEEMQRRVQQLTAQVAQHQHLRQENTKLREETARLTAMLQAAAAAQPPGIAAAVATAAADRPVPLSSASMPEVSAQHAAAQQQQQARPRRQQQPASGGSGVHDEPQRAGGARPSSSVAVGGNGAFKPTAAVRALAPSTLAELPLGGAPAPVQPAAPPSGRQVHAALDLFYQDLQGFAALVQLERVPVDGAGLGADAALRLTELVRTGLELVKMVLQTSGADAALLLTAGLPTVGADGVSPADSLAQWRMVAARVALTAEQHAQLADWRRRFLQKLDDCYGRRLLHKVQLAQLPGAGGTTAAPGQPPQLVEALLLQAAEGVGFSACAVACAQLDGVVAALQENLREERATAGAMMTELLDRILTKVQAARFLLAGHPFCWNGLSFARAAASLAPAGGGAVKQEQLSELLARLQQVAAPSAP